MSVEPLLDGVDHLHRVGAGLPADGEQHRRLAVHVGAGQRLGHAVLDPRDVAQQDRVAVALLDDDVAELLDRLHAAARAQGERRGALLDAAAGDLRVLRLQRAGDVGDRQVVGLQPRGIERDVDLARTSAD